MSQPPERPARANLILGPRGITLDETGRIRIADPEILEAIVATSPLSREAAGEGNASQCQCNLSQCGGG